MIFSHIGAGHKDDSLSNEAELRDGAGSGTTNDQVGSLIGCTHIADEVCHLQIVGTSHLTKLLGNLGTIVFSCLPNELHIALTNQVKMLQDTFVDGTSPQATTHEQDGFLCRIEPERTYCLFMGDRRFEQGLTYRIARHHDAVGRKEAFHSLVGHAYFLCCLTQYLIGLACKGILLLNEAGNST